MLFRSDHDQDIFPKEKMPMDVRELQEESMSECSKNIKNTISDQEIKHIQIISSGGITVKDMEGSNDKLCKKKILPNISSRTNIITLSPEQEIAIDLFKQGRNIFRRNNMLFLK